MSATPITDYPPLENGDRLTRQEFERRNTAMAHIKKAELIAEIAASSASYNLNDKLNAYRRNGVQEYIVWQSYENRLDWFRLQEGRYVALQPDEAGIIRSEIFPGLWLAVKALREGDIAGVLAVLQQGLQTAKHQAFVKRLNPQ